MALRYLFVDMNAYFASVEQEYRPELRGRPVAVAAVLTDRTCCLAASYEAKRFGIRTGTNIGEARRLCRGLRVVEARPPLYVVVHEQIVAAVNRVLPVEKVCSIDEMYGRLNPEDRTPERAAALGRAVKRSIADQVGSQLRCSVGLAPNVMLAKMATDMHKPDGLVVIRDEELPTRLHALKLTDFPGIAHRTEARLQRCNIYTVEQFCAASVSQLSRVWHSRLLGECWWRKLRGEDLPEVPTQRRTVGHSHVLPPELRSDHGAHLVLVRLLHKAAARMRRLGYCARTLSVGVYHLGGGGWSESVRFPYCRDTLTLLERFEQLWARRPQARPLKVAVTLHDLRPAANVTRSLFPEDDRRSDLADAMDRINGQFGSAGIHFAGMLGAQDADRNAIAFSRIPDPSEGWISRYGGAEHEPDLFGRDDMS